MSAYQTVVVGTDGSESSMKAVERAGAISGDKAQLIIACAVSYTHLKLPTKRIV